MSKVISGDDVDAAVASIIEFINESTDDGHGRVGVGSDGAVRLNGIYNLREIAHAALTSSPEGEEVLRFVPVSAAESFAYSGLSKPIRCRLGFHKWNGLFYSTCERCKTPEPGVPVFIPPEPS